MTDWWRGKTDVEDDGPPKDAFRELEELLHRSPTPKPPAFYADGCLYILVPGKWVKGKWVEEHYEPQGDVQL